MLQKTKTDSFFWRKPIILPQLKDFEGEVLKLLRHGQTVNILWPLMRRPWRNECSMESVKSSK